MIIALTLAALQSIVCYELLGSSSHVSVLIGMLAVLPSVLSSLFLSFKQQKPLVEREGVPLVSVSQHRSVLFQSIVRIEQVQEEVKEEVQEGVVINPLRFAS